MQLSAMSPRECELTDHRSLFCRIVIFTRDYWRGICARSDEQLVGAPLLPVRVHRLAGRLKIRMPHKEKQR